MTLRKIGRRASAVVVASLVAILTTWVTASPASANVLVQNDGETACLDNGEYAITYRIENGEPFAIKLTSLTTTPMHPQRADNLTDTVLEPMGDIRFWQLAPSGTTAASFTVTWERVSEPSVTGSFTATAIQPFLGCEPRVFAEFTPDCDETVRVKLLNTTRAAVNFFVNGDEHAVAAGGVTVLEDMATQSGVIAVTVPLDFLGIDLPVTRFTWTEPGGCSTPTVTTTTTTAAAGLANTGASLTGLIGVGAGLVAVGLALLVSLGIRRRRADTA
jgi:hypothetical protein